MEIRKGSSSMLLRVSAAILLLILVRGVMPCYANAQQTVAYMRSCAGCTLAGYVSTAESQPDGVSFLYDLKKQDIRKFVVTSTTNCGPGGVSQALKAQAVTSCPTTKSAEQLPVDASVVQIFNKMIAIAQVNPKLWNSARDVIHLRNFPNGGIDPYTGEPFDLPEAAWEYPGGTFYRLEKEIEDDLSSQAILEDLDPSLADLIYGIQVPSLQGITITLAENPSATVSLVFDRNSLTNLEVCNESDDCAEFTVQVTKSQVKISFQDVVDLAGNAYPEPNKNTKTQTWYWRDSTGADHFANFLNRHGTVNYVGAGCWNNTEIVCSVLKDTNGKAQSLGCTYECY
jgi:hypothetical protein